MPAEDQVTTPDGGFYQRRTPDGNLPFSFSSRGLRCGEPTVVENPDGTFDVTFHFATVPDLEAMAYQAAFARE